MRALRVEVVAADLKEGVLTLTVPKRPEVQPRKIAIASESEKASKGKA